RERPDAVFVGQDAFFNGRRLQLANWAVRHALPMTSGSRDICEVGGLMSYGTNIVDTYRQMAVYVGRILKGAKPADLPVQQWAMSRLTINREPGRSLVLKFPPTWLGRADEVLEYPEGGGGSNEPPPPKFPASGGGCCRAPSCVARHEGASLSDAAGAHHRGVCS